MDVTTTNGAVLVAGNQSDALTTEANPATGMHDVYSQGADITSSITGGQLQGLITPATKAFPLPSPRLIILLLDLFPR